MLLGILISFIHTCFIISALVQEQSYNYPSVHDVTPKAMDEVNNRPTPHPKTNYSNSRYLFLRFNVCRRRMAIHFHSGAIVQWLEWDSLNKKVMSNQLTAFSGNISQLVICILFAGYISYDGWCVVPLNKNFMMLWKHFPHYRLSVESTGHRWFP